MVGQENMLFEWEKSGRCIICTEIVSSHAYTTLQENTCSLKLVAMQ